MATYKISGVWVNDSKAITHYAFHTQTETGHTRARKTAKADAIKLLETAGNTAWTWVWNYRTAQWDNGEKVELVNGSTGKYLRSNPDNKLTDNLSHLIDFDWIMQ